MILLTCINCTRTCHEKSFVIDLEQPLHRTFPYIIGHRGQFTMKSNVRSRMKIMIAYVLGPDKSSTLVYLDSSSALENTRSYFRLTEPVAVYISYGTSLWWKKNKQIFFCMTDQFDRLEDETETKFCTLEPSVTRRKYPLYSPRLKGKKDKARILFKWAHSSNLFWFPLTLWHLHLRLPSRTQEIGNHLLQKTRRLYCNIQLR